MLNNSHIAGEKKTLLYLKRFGETYVWKLPGVFLILTLIKIVKE